MQILVTVNRESYRNNDVTGTSSNNRVVHTGNPRLVFLHGLCVSSSSSSIYFNSTTSISEWVYCVAKHNLHLTMFETDNKGILFISIKFIYYYIKQTTK